MSWIKWYRSKTAWVIIITAVVAFISCNKEDVILEPTPTRMAIMPELHRVNIIVDNQAKGVVFESDSIVLRYQEMGLCKTFETEAFYIDDIVLNGNIRTECYSIYSGDIRIPILQYIPDSINYIDVVLYDGCPWYSPDGNRVLQSIQFDNPNVEEWEEDNEIK